MSPVSVFSGLVLSAALASPSGAAAVFSARRPLRLGPVHAPLVADRLNQGLCWVWQDMHPGPGLTPEKLLSALAPQGKAGPGMRLPDADLAALHIALEGLAADPARAKALSERMRTLGGRWKESADRIGHIRDFHREGGLRGRMPGERSLLAVASQLRRRLREAGSPEASSLGLGRLLESLFDDGPASGRRLIRRLRAPLAANTFTRDRGLDEYGMLLGREFMRDFLRLGPGDHVILPGGEGVVAKDYFRSGSITEGRAYRDIVLEGRGGGARTPDEKLALRFFRGMEEASRKPAVEKASVTNIAFRAGRRPLSRADHDGRYRRLTGRYFERIPNRDMLARRGGAGKVRVVDVNDALLYTPFPSEVLAKYLSLIGTEGTLYVFLGHPRSGNGLLKDRVISADGKEGTFADWLRGIPGLSVRGVRNKAFGLESLSFVIRRSGGVRVPRLKLIEVRKTPRQAGSADKVRVFRVSE